MYAAAPRDYRELLGLQFLWTSRQRESAQMLKLPYWLPVVLTAAIPAAWLAAFARCPPGRCKTRRGPPLLATISAPPPTAARNAGPLPPSLTRDERRILNLLTMLSLVACVAAAGLCVRSYAWLHGCCSPGGCGRAKCEP